MFWFSISLLFVNSYYFIAKYIIATNLTINLCYFRKKPQEGTIKMHGLASHFVYVATIVLGYVYMCIIIFVSAHNTLVFKAKYFIN